MFFLALIHPNFTAIANALGHMLSALCGGGISSG